MRDALSCKSKKLRTLQRYDVPDLRRLVGVIGELARWFEKAAIAHVLKLVAGAGCDKRPLLRGQTLVIGNHGAARVRYAKRPSAGSADDLVFAVAQTVQNPLLVLVTDILVRTDAAVVFGSSVPNFQFLTKTIFGPPIPNVGAGPTAGASTVPPPTVCGPAFMVALGYFVSDGFPLSSRFLPPPAPPEVAA